jgi:hypothetical protein
MSRALLLLGLIAIVLSVIVFGPGPTKAATVDSSKTACLACHGPYDALISATANYNGWVNGEKTSPHRYEPHDSKNVKDIPECRNCHRKPHPLPPTASDIAAMDKPDNKFCYSCHHRKVLQCWTCHK